MALLLPLDRGNQPLELGLGAHLAWLRRWRQQSCQGIGEHLAGVASGRAGAGAGRAPIQLELGAADCAGQRLPPGPRLMQGLLQRVVRRHGRPPAA